MTKSIRKQKRTKSEETTKVSTPEPPKEEKQTNVEELPTPRPYRGKGAPPHKS